MSKTTTRLLPALLMLSPLVSASENHPIWAVNAGGDAFESADGIAYAADSGFSGGGVEKLAAQIKASHNPGLYQSERRGERFSYARKLPDGRYNLTLRFAESSVDKTGERTFSVDVEGRERIAGLDVRDISGALNTAYSVTIPNIEVGDGALNIDFRGEQGAASLSALLVTEPHTHAQEWQLYWSDEFDYSGAPDPEKWNLEVQPPGWVNDELQYYTDRPENIRVQDGALVVEGRREDYKEADYTSGRIHSRNKGDLLYGRVEVRAKLPTGRGTWPAIWMMPTDLLGYGEGWPDSGEIDIMEHVGYDQGQVHATVHNKAFYWVNGMQRKGSVMVGDVSETFHEYAVEWDRGRMDFFIDDVPYFTYINDGGGWKSWPFDKPFYVILNLAIGGNWGGAKGVDTGIWPRRMEVDYVRMYRPI